VKYRRWTPQSVDLSAYVGTSVTVEFVVSACMYGGHFAYAYIDAPVWNCNCKCVAGRL